MENDLFHSIEHLLQRVESKISTLKQHIATEQQTMDDLKAKGLIYAGTWMKAGKYMYLIHPSDGFGSRKREYVGADPAAIQTALDGIQRGHDYNAAAHRRSRIQNQLNQVTQYLTSAAKC